MRNTLLSIALISLGAASGYGIKRVLTPAPPQTTAPPPPKHSSSAPASPGTTAPPWQIPENRPPSEIASLPSGAMRTAETVLWLPHATPDELRAFWRQLIASNSNDYRLKNLLLDRWMRVAPDDALKETAGSADEYLPWVAWGRIDPELGVREAKARKSGYLWRVLQGAGSTQPERARKLLAENPGYDYPAVTHAIKDGLQDQGWEVALNYLFEGRQLADWARYEPAQAFGWALDHPAKMLEPGSWKGVVEQMLDEDPAKLDATIAKLPEGKLKSDITLEKARALVASDPAAVMAMADAAEPGGPRDRLLAIVAPTLVESHPAKALELLREFAPHGFDRFAVVYPNGGSTSGNIEGYSAIDSWVLPLLKQDPATVIGILPAEAKEQALRKWSMDDRNAFGNWASSLPDEAERDKQFFNLAGVYRIDSDPSNESFAEAMNWTARISQEWLRSQATRSMVEGWLSGHREQVMRYFGPDGPATNQEKAEFRKALERNGGQQ